MVQSVESGAARKTVFLVVGMHRTGTSAFARILGLSGCALPTGDALANNDEAIQAPGQLVELNDQILLSGGSSWDDWREFDPDWYRSASAGSFHVRAQELLERQFGNAQLFTLNDPQICRLLPFWLEAIHRFKADPVVVLPIRHPTEVAALLYVDHGMSLPAGRLLWLRYVLDAELATRGIRRCFVRYEDLVASWRRVVQRVSTELGVVFPPQSPDDAAKIDAFHSTHLLGNDRPRATGSSDADPVDWAQQVYAVLSRWRSVGECDSHFGELNDIRTAFGAAAQQISEPNGQRIPGAELSVATKDFHGPLSDKLELLKMELAAIGGGLSLSRNNEEHLLDQLRRSRQYNKKLKERVRKTRQSLKSNRRTVRLLRRERSSVSQGKYSQTPRWWTSFIGLHLSDGPTRSTDDVPKPGRHAQFTPTKNKKRRMKRSNARVKPTGKQRLARLNRGIDLRKFDASEDELHQNAQINDNFFNNPHLRLDHALWILPPFTQIYRGGIYTIFRFAEHFTKTLGTKNTIVIYDELSEIDYHYTLDTIKHAFPDLWFELRLISSPAHVNNLPPSDGAFCTLWTTAYLLLRYNRCKAKYYFVQDYEPAFYPAGSRFGAIEQTYRFGFIGIANTPGVGESYRQYNRWLTHFVPGVDHGVFYPRPNLKRGNAPCRIVFYGRPRNARNAFELGVEALRIVKQRLRDKVDIISAGADYDVEAHGLDGVLTNYGLLSSVQEVAELYRSVDIGLVFMFTAHPSYQPFEYMASGCATVTNINRYTGWLLKDGENSILTPATPGLVADALVRLVVDSDLRHRIIEGGLATASAFDWKAALDHVSRFVCSPRPTEQPLLSPDTNSLALGRTKRRRPPKDSERIAERFPVQGDLWSIAAAKYESSIEQRVRQITDYRSRIAAYNRAKSQRPPAGYRIAIYTAVTGEYETLKLPEVLEDNIDYFLFTDKPASGGDIFTVSPITYFVEDPTLTARYVKTHPHLLVRGYDVAIWMDANIMLVDRISPIVDAFIASNALVGGIKHPRRQSFYEEAEEVIRRGLDDVEIVKGQVERYRREGFDHSDLLETNVMFFRLGDKRVANYLNLWWAEISANSKRDQLSVNYALKRSAIDWFPIMEFPKSALDHPAFVRISHDTGGSAEKLLDVVGSEVVEQYSSVPYAEVRQTRIEKQKQRRIDVIVCVHNALEDVMKCLESIRLTHSSDNHRLLIVDDGSNDEVSSYLEQYSISLSWARLLRNEESVGYTRSANRGIASSSGDFVVLLNSDTVVSDGWLEKLADAVCSSPGAGIVGPLSNAASRQSIPQHKSSEQQTAINALPDGVTVEDMNRLCEEWTVADILPRVPLIHGFCFGVTRAVIDAIGVFDEDSFPTGYGEENDYCFRAADAGFELVVATHTYIFHAKSKSFVGDDRITLMKEGGETLERLHGRRRIQRAVRSMQKNPMLLKMRKRAQTLYPAITE